MLANLIQDRRFAVRSLLRSPALLVTVLLTLALGIGANVAIFTVVNGILLRPLPYRDVDRIIQLANGESAATLSEPEIVDLARDARSFSLMGAYSYDDGNVTGTGGDAERIKVANVTAGFFGVLGPSMLSGRSFTDDEDRPGGAPVVVVSHALWERRFGNGPLRPNQQVIIDGTPRQIVGVLPSGFDFPTAAVDVWAPARLNRTAPGPRNNHSWRLLGRLTPIVSLEQAAAEVAALKTGWAREYPDIYPVDRPLIADVVPLRDRIVGPTRPYLLALTGAAGFVLLIACVNVANLLLARGETRRKELAVRAALGASRGRLALQLFTENALLTVAGCVLGLLLAWAATRLLVAAAPPSIPRLTGVGLDLSVLGFAVGVALTTGCLFGLVPALRAAHASGDEELRDGSKTTASAGTARSRRARRALVTAEVTLAVVLVAGAGLLTRSLVNLERTDLGFASDDLVTARLSLPRDAYDMLRRVAFIDALVDRLGHVPGAQKVAAMAWTPIVDGGGMWSVMSDAMTPSATSEAPTAAPQQVTPDFFRTIGIPIKRGRAFEASDRADAPLVAVVNEVLARRMWGDADPVGRKLSMYGPHPVWATVVGVAGDTRLDGITEPPPPAMYFPYAQASQSAYFASPSMTLAIATHGDQAAIVKAIRQAVRELDPNVPVSEVRPMTAVVGSTIASRRFATILLGGFALLAVALAGIGIYGVIAYGVTQRRYEIGVRMALGAARRNVLLLVMREGAVTTVGGLLLGLYGVISVGRLLRSLLVGVQVVDLVTLAATVTLLLVVSVAATIAPARRAMRVSPTEALRGS